MSGHVYYRTAKDDNDSKEMVNLKNRKYVSLLLYYCPDIVLSGIVVRVR